MSSSLDAVALASGQESDFGEETARALSVSQSAHRSSGAHSLASRVVRGKRAWVIGPIAALCVVVGWMSRSSSPCVPRGGPLSIVSLVENDREDLVHLPQASDDAIADWLAAGEAVSRQVRSDPSTRVNAAKAVARALGDKKTTEAVVVTAASRAAGKWQDKRRYLKQHLTAKKLNATLRGLHRGMPKLGMSPAERTSVASCFFDISQTVTQIAALAANINDAVETCEHARSDNPWAQKTCAINIQSIFASAATIASTISLATNNCADTIQPRLGSLCAGSIATMIQTVTQLSVSAELVASACGKGSQESVMPGFTPGNLGGPLSRRLVEENATEAQARRLLFGGGKGSVGTQCYVDISSSLWYLAEAGLAINAAANPGAGKSCPPRHLYQGKILTGSQHRQSQAFCAADVAGAMYGFFQSFYFIFLSVVHCTDAFVTGAACGAGVNGILGSLVGIAHSGSSMWLACDELKKTWPIPGAGSPIAQDMLKANVLGNSGLGGRRLEGVEGGVPQLKDKFSSPVEAFKSLGFDITDKKADFRQEKPPEPLAKDVLELFEDRPSDHAQDSLSTQCA